MLMPLTHFQKPKHAGFTSDDVEENSRGARLMSGGG
jgi:hypothetical protein